jgi:hypothetical protein
MRITKDLTTMFVKKIKYETPNEDVENRKYLQILQPSLDSFLHAFCPLEFSFLDLYIRLFLFLENSISFPFQEKHEKSLLEE